MTADAPSAVGTGAAGPVGASVRAAVGAPPRPATVPAHLPPVPADTPGRGPGGRARGRLRRVDPHRAAVVAVVLAVVVGACLRFATGAHLWLDEVLTVEISRRPLTGGDSLFAALRNDGAPPLFYLLLHFWMMLFGDGDIAVRALSGVLSCGTLVPAWFAGRRVGRAAVPEDATPETAAAIPRRAGIAAVLLFATSPYAIRYGSETRMYSLVVLVVLLFGLALVRVMEVPTRRRYLLLTAATTAMAYTHYWTFLLLATVAAFLLVQMRRRAAWRDRCRGALLAMLAAAIPFAPWISTFAFQMLHTGTPWAPPVHAQVLLDTIFSWAGPESTGALLGIVLITAALIGSTARPQGRLLLVDPRGQAPGRYLFALFLAPLVLAYFAYVAGGSAYTERYTGVALPSFLLLAALGIALLPLPRLRTAALVVAVVTGLAGGWSLAREERTQAGQIASTIAALARPGDVVAFCPDQLGPAVHRALARSNAPALRQIAFADPRGPELVDWVDYAARMEAASGADFATTVTTMAGPDHAVFLVRADGYRTLEDKCSVISDQLATVRDRTQLISRRSLLEGASLERFSTNG